jgi:hypothetical protein
VGRDRQHPRANDRERVLRLAVHLACGVEGLPPGFVHPGTACARGRVLGETSVIDAATMMTVDSTPLDLAAEDPVNREAATQAVKVDLPPGIDVSALILELEGTVGMRCTAATPDGKESSARVRVPGEGPVLTWRCAPRLHPTSTPHAQRRIASSCEVLRSTPHDEMPSWPSFPPTRTAMDEFR